MKKYFKYMFIFLICFMFVDGVYAKTTLNCEYTGTSTNENYIVFNNKIELELVLDGNKAKVNKLVIHTSPQNVKDCKNEVGINESFANEFCSSKVKDFTSLGVDIGFSISEGDSCPKKIDIMGENPKKIYIPTDNIGYKKTSEVIYNTKTSCGNITEIPRKIPELTSFAVTLIQIAIPIVLILLGSIDLFKGITANKEDEIKKGQQMFIKRLIYAAIIFFVVIIVKFVISIVADATTTENLVDCIDCFIDYESCGR